MNSEIIIGDWQRWEDSHCRLQFWCTCYWKAKEKRLVMKQAMILEREYKFV